MTKNLNLTEGQEDLRIVEHLDCSSLPESVQQMLSLASTPEEQDIILMATLAAASACVPDDKRGCARGSTGDKAAGSEEGIV